MKINLNNYKGAIIDYGCNICNINDNFFEDFTNKISRIKSDGCEHLDIKFIYNLEKNSLKYMVSFNCKNCGENKIFDLCKYSNDLSIHYKCNKCKNGNTNVQMILSEEIFKIDDGIKKQNKPNDNKINFINPNSNQINNFININQSINNMNLVGGNQNIFNNNLNFNNNIMMNNFNHPINQNIMNFQNNNLFMNNNFNNANMNPNVNQINMMMGNMNLNNINNNLNNSSNASKTNNKSVNLIFKDTQGLQYNFPVSSLDCVFSEVVREFLKKNI